MLDKWLSGSFSKKKLGTYNLQNSPDLMNSSRKKVHLIRVLSLNHLDTYRTFNSKSHTFLLFHWTKSVFQMWFFIKSPKTIGTNLLFVPYRRSIESESPAWRSKRKHAPPKQFWWWANFDEHWATWPQKSLLASDFWQSILAKKCSF